MKKADFVKIINPSNLDRVVSSRSDGAYTVSDEKKSICAKYGALIMASLTFAPDSLEMGELSSLSEIDNWDNFLNFIKASTSEQLENKFKAIRVDIDTLSKKYLNETSIAKSLAKANEVKDKWLEKKQRTNHIVFCVFIAFTIILTLGIAIFSILEEFNVVDFGGKLSAICGVLDFINGVAFFIYERIDDRRKKDMRNDLNEISGIHIHNSKNNVKGNNNNFGVILNGGEQEEKIDPAKIEKFIDTYNVKNKVKGDNNNFGYRKS